MRRCPGVQWWLRLFAPVGELIFDAFRWVYKVYNLIKFSQDGVKTDEFCSLDSVDVECSYPLLHQVIEAYRSNSRVGTAKSKSRAEVSGSSSKLYKQKGTGNSRAGNKRTPLRRGGGHAFAKNPKSWRVGMPRKSLMVATRQAICGKIRDEQLFVLSGLVMSGPKTKVVEKILRNLGVYGSSVLLIVADYDCNIVKSSRNIVGLSALPACDLNCYQVLRSRNLVITEPALRVLCLKFGLSLHVPKPVSGA